MNSGRAKVRTATVLPPTTEMFTCASTKLPFCRRNPHHTHDAVVTLDMPLSAPGLYWVRLYANDDMVAHRGFAVSQDVPRFPVSNQ